MDDTTYPLQYNKLLFNLPSDAAMVWTELLKQARRSRMATLDHYHELCGITGHFSDHAWGWTWEELQDVTIKAVEDPYGYELTLPEPKSRKDHLL